MERSNTQNGSESLQAPEWMLTAARHAIKASGINPEEALAARLRDARDQAKAGTKQHQETMLVLAEKMKELRDKHGLQFSTVEQGKAVQAPRSSEQDPAKAVTQKGVNRTLDISKRKETAHEPSSRGNKKPKVRFEVKSPIKKKPAPTPKDTAHQSRTRNPTTPPDDLDLVDPDQYSSPTISVSEKEPTERYSVPSELPRWYTSISPDSLAMKALSKKRPSALTALDSLKALVSQCEKFQNNPSSLPTLYDKLRDAVHKAEITLVVTAPLIRKANMLSPAAGLPRIFKPKTQFPEDLKADAYQLFRRWHKGDLAQDLLRGIITKKSHNRTTDSIAPDYRRRFPTNARYHGQGDLVLGQWWPTQLCAVRDGAHGSPQGGISGDKTLGAFSVVLSSGHGYNDIDTGDVIHYSGTKSSTSTPTENTQALLASHKSGNPIRVIRSAQLSPKNKFRPERGLRYDGLYTVKGYEVLDEEFAVYRFRLERCGGQREIRWQGKARRPSSWEVREYERLRDRGAW